MSFPCLINIFLIVIIPIHFISQFFSNFTEKAAYAFHFWETLLMIKIQTTFYVG